MDPLECNMWKSERFYQPTCLYFTYQKNITEQMRSIAAEWMMECMREYKGTRESYYLALNFMDRYLTYNIERGSIIAERNTFQKIATACMVLAMKFEEISVPKFEVFLFSAANTFKEVDLCTMEIDILKVLDWRLMPPTPYNWLCLFLKKINSVLDDSIVNTMMFWIDIFSLSTLSLRFYPSHIAASCLYLFFDIEYNDEIKDATSYSMDQLQPCIDILEKICHYDFQGSETHPHSLQSYCESLLTYLSIIEQKQTDPFIYIDIERTLPSSLSNEISNELKRKGFLRTIRQSFDPTTNCIY